jgi:hypothetical protein
VPLLQRPDAGNAGARVKLPRVVASVAAVALLALGAVAACGGDEGADRTNPNPGPTFTIATFTPVPPDFTPEAFQTSQAQQTAFAQTATAQPPVTATIPPSVTIQPDPNVTPAAENEIRPPDAVLRTVGGDALGSIGSYNWFNPTLQSGAEITAPYVPLPDAVASWATGTAGRIDVPNSPFAVVSAGVTIYTARENTAIPTDLQGNPSDELAFYPQQAPVQQMTVQDPSLSITPAVEPGEYIMSVTINWQTPQNLPSPLYTQYVYLVTVI